MLHANMESLRRQTCQDYIQTILDDPDGRGIGWSYSNMAAYAPKLTGQYIWILDDDDMVASRTFVADLKRIEQEFKPDVIMVKMDHGPRGILPNRTWQRRPEIGDIGCSAFVVKRRIWQRHARLFSATYAGDFDFINSIFARDYDPYRARIYWFDSIASRVQRISLGVPE
jgi:hypothetical protein